MHISTITRMLMQAFDGKLCNPSITSDDRKAVIREFMSLYFQMQAQERELKAERESERLRYMLEETLDNTYSSARATCVPVEDFTPDPTFNTRKYPKNN